MENLEQHPKYQGVEVSSDWRKYGERVKSSLYGEGSFR